MYAAPNKEVYVTDSLIGGRPGYGYGYGGDGIGAGGWVAGGIGFLFLVFIIFGFAFFQRAHGKDIHDGIRDSHNGNNASALANARFQGKTEARQEDMYQSIQEIGEKLGYLNDKVTHGFDKTCEEIHMSEKNQELFGQNFGYRSFEKVYPNPCCDDERRGERRGDRREHCGPRRTVTAPYTAPTTVADTFDVCCN